MKEAVKPELSLQELEAIQNSIKMIIAGIPPKHELFMDLKYVSDKCALYEEDIVHYDKRNT